jgi:hypothetical protein
MALVVKRTAAAGGADATQTSAAGVWGVVDALLLAAGWTVLFDYSSGILTWIPSVVLPPTPSLYFVGDIIENLGNRYQCISSGAAASSGTGPSGTSQSIADGSVIWRFMTSAGVGDKVYTSTGESGNERLFVRVNHSIVSSTPYVNMYFYQYFDSGTKFGYNRIGPGTGSLTQYSYTAGNTVNYVMVADKDSFQCFTNDNVNVRRMFGGGRLNRWHEVIATHFTSNATVTAGLSATYNFSSGNPIASGYKIGDRVFVVSQQANAGSPYDGLIPVFSAVITALTTSSITVDNAKETTTAGAFIGADPQCQFCWTNSALVDPIANANAVFCSYRWDNTVTNLWSGAGELGIPHPGGGGGLITQAPAEMDPNARTGFVHIGEITLNSNGNEILGILPKYFSNPRTSDALWSIGRSVRETTNYDYVTFPQNTLSPSGQRRSLIGPIATSGGSNYSVFIQRVTADTLLEAEIEEAASPTGTDRGISRTHGSGFDKGEAIQVEDFIEIPENVIVEAQIVELNDVSFQTQDRVAPSALGTTVEPVPADSPTSTGGGGSSGFNSGIN